MDAKEFIVTVGVEDFVLSLNAEDLVLRVGMEEEEEFLDFSLRKFLRSFYCNSLQHERNDYTLRSCCHE